MFLIISWSLETPLYDFMTMTNNTKMNEYTHGQCLGHTLTIDYTQKALTIPADL